MTFLYARTINVLGYMLQDEGYPVGSNPQACLHKKISVMTHLLKSPSLPLIVLIHGGC